MGIAEIISFARGEGREFLFEDEAKKILSLRGISVTPCAVADTEDEAVYQAGLLVFPAVLKVRSTGPGCQGKDRRGRLILFLIP